MHPSPKHHESLVCGWLLQPTHAARTSSPALGNGFCQSLSTVRGRMRKHQYNQGDLLRFQRTVGIGPFTPYLCVITEVLIDNPLKYYRIQWLHDSSLQVYDSRQVDSDSNFKLLARARKNKNLSIIKGIYSDTEIFSM